MKLLIFGDVHGNLISLEKLFQIEKNNFDSFVCHGDIVNYGPWTNECLEFLSQKKEAGVFLKGNHEEYYLEGFYPGSNEVAKSFFDFCFPRFDNKYLPFISEFNKSYKTEVFKVMHTFGDKYIFQDTDINEMEFENNTIIGHSHQQYHRVIDNKNLYNTGSLGQNRALLNLANYLLVDMKTGKIEMKSFIFDINKIISEMEAQKYPEICLNYYKSKKTVNE
jgi:predicted phosphodiesterase